MVELHMYTVCVCINDRDVCWWRPAVCFGLSEGEVEQSQTGEGGLHAVGQSPGAAVPREPWAQMAEELETTRQREAVSGRFAVTHTVDS